MDIKKTIADHEKTIAEAEKKYHEQQEKELQRMRVNADALKKFIEDTVEPIFEKTKNEILENGYECQIDHPDPIADKEIQEDPIYTAIQINVFKGEYGYGDGVSYHASWGNRNFAYLKYQGDSQGQNIKIEISIPGRRPESISSRIYDEGEPICERSVSWLRKRTQRSIWRLKLKFSDMDPPGKPKKPQEIRLRGDGRRPSVHLSAPEPRNRRPVKTSGRRG